LLNDLGIVCDPITHRALLLDADEIADKERFILWVRPSHKSTVAFEETADGAVDCQIRLDKLSTGVGARVNVALSPSLDGPGATCENSGPTLSSDGRPDVLQLRVLEKQGGGKLSRTASGDTDEDWGVAHVGVDNRLSTNGPDGDVKSDSAVPDSEALPSPTWRVVSSVQLEVFEVMNSLTPVPGGPDGSLGVVDFEILHRKPEEG